MPLFRSISVLFFLSMSTIFSGLCQTFIGKGGKIVDDGSENIFLLLAGPLQKENLDSVFGLEEVCINIRHEYDDDLDIFLISPDGIAVELSTNNGYSGLNYTNTCFTNESQMVIPDGVAPFTGKYRPEGFLSDFNRGGHGNGDWKLLIHDTYPKEKSGEVLSWHIRFGNKPAKPFRMHQSNLPIMRLITNGVIIPDEPKIVADMDIIDKGLGNFNLANDSVSPFKSKIAIEGRGQSSRSFPKKHYGFITINPQGEKINSPLLGMPSANEWTLNPAYNEKTLLRNVMSYGLYAKMGHYSVRTRYVDLILNDNPMGVYVLTERITRGKNRVDVSRLSKTDTAGDQLSGGYIFKIDWNKNRKNEKLCSRYLSGKNRKKVYFQTVSPKPENILPIQADYLMLYLDSFETALQGKGFKLPTGEPYTNFIDINSFIDYWILTEASKNIDGYSKSVFYYKDKRSKNGRIFCGPVWDYDIAWGNANFGGAAVVKGWQWLSEGDKDRNPPFWWHRLMEDSVFVQALKKRYFDLRKDVLNTQYLFQTIDSSTAYLGEARKRNFRIWPIIGRYTWPNPEPVPQSYAEEILYLKSWIEKRLAWMDANLR